MRYSSSDLTPRIPLDKRDGFSTSACVAGNGEVGSPKDNKALLAQAR